MEALGSGVGVGSKGYSPPSVDRIWLWVYYYIMRFPYTPYSIYLRGTISV